MGQLKISNGSITSRERDSLDRYLQEIGKYPLITAEEEVILAQKIKNGDTIALEKLINSNLRFVVSIAKLYQKQGLSLPDLINEGNIWLIKAAKIFDETRGFKFISFAVWWIRAKIMEAINKEWAMVRKPSDWGEYYNNIKKIRNQLEQAIWCEIPEAFIALEMEKLEDPDKQKRGDTRDKFYGKGGYISLNESLPHDPESDGIGNFMGNDDFCYLYPQTDHSLDHTEWLSRELSGVFSLLKKNQAKALRLSSKCIDGISLTTAEIAQELKITPQAVRDNIDRAKETIRKNPKILENLRAYL